MDTRIDARPPPHVVTDLIVKAIWVAGSEHKLAKACGVSQARIWRAKTQGRIAADLANSIHAFTGGRVSRHDLCPDIFGPRKGSAARAKES